MKSTFWMENTGWWHHGRNEYSKTNNGRNSIETTVYLVYEDGLIQVNSAGNLLEASTCTKSNGTNLNFITLGYDTGKYDANGRYANLFNNLYPYPIPDGAKTITVLCSSDFASIIVYYDKDSLATTGTGGYARGSCAKVVDGQTPAAGTAWSISSWEYGNKAYTIPTGINANSFTIGLRAKTATVYNNFDITNPGISIEFGY